MKKLFPIYITMIAGSILFSTRGATPAEVEEMIRAGMLDDASAAVDSMAQAKPKAAEPDYLRGQIALGRMDFDAATRAFEAAHKKGMNEALLPLAEIANRTYRTGDATGYLDTYRAYIAKNKRKKLTDQSGDLEERIAKTRNMLDRVEAIEVFDSIVVDADDFFRHYRLSPQSGSLLGPEQVGDMGFEAAVPSVAYLTEDGRELIWPQENAHNLVDLRKSDSLVGDSWGEPEEVGDHLSLGADANYPFLMPDGVTLYYASNAEGGMGGYDIYMSRNNGTRFLDPQNVGMPYNSPDDDYMLAIDEINGIGWWASDRNHIPGKVTIYLFVPSEMRRNVSADDPMLVAKASLSSIAVTQNPDFNYESLRRKLAVADTAKNERKALFEFALPDGTVARTFDDFRSVRARQAMERYLAAEHDMLQMQNRLTELRTEFAVGNRNVSNEIVALEKHVDDARAALLRTANEVVKAEFPGAK